MRWLSIGVFLCLHGSAAPIPGTGVLDAASAACVVSYEGAVWYRVPAGVFAPIDVRRERCAPEVLSLKAPPVPRWAHPRESTQAIFVAASLQEIYSAGGMPTMERLAQMHHIPMTWMIGTAEYPVWNAELYTTYHARNGDDVEVVPYAPLIWTVRSLFPWYVPVVSIEGAGHERFLRSSPHPRGMAAFWGIAWNSHTIDGTYDYGTPWGTYCADPRSYKRPDPTSGKCTLLAFEWTARDLTRAYLGDHEEYFSTDPDDLQRRAGFTVSGARKYVREIVDAYAAAGQTQPLVMIAQQESAEALNDGDDAILDALYGEAVADGMRAMTLAQAASAARAFSAVPRAVAFPFLSGGKEIPSPLLGDAVVYPATIDYHDTQVGMTFLAGHLLPTRVFRYADSPMSAFNVPLWGLSPRAMPTLSSAVVGRKAIRLRLQAPVALRYGIALWSNPTSLGLSGPGVTFAGNAGAVVVFDLRAGRNDITIPCRACIGDALPYAT